MADAMLTELYRRVFETKREAEACGSGEINDRRRGSAIAKNKLLSELIDVRTQQIENGQGGA